MVLTDTHAHLYTEQFDEDRDAMIRRAIDAGITRFFLPAIDSTYTDAMLQLKQEYPSNIHLMMGLHPTHVKENFEQELAHVERMLEEHDFVAVGEIGIDLYWDTSTKDIQEKAFRYQINLAKKHDLPIVIHCRESFDEIFEVLESENHPRLRGIFHCFTGTRDQAEKAISMGMKLGIGGVLTFKNGKIDKFLNEIDLEHIVLETDSPYLAPVPFRGKRNESKYLMHILDKMVDIYGKPAEEIARITTKNSMDIFKV